MSISTTVVCLKQKKGEKLIENSQSIKCKICKELIWVAMSSIKTVDFDFHKYPHKKGRGVNPA